MVLVVLVVLVVGAVAMVGVVEVLVGDAVVFVAAVAGDGVVVVTATGLEPAAEAVVALAPAAMDRASAVSAGAVRSLRDFRRTGPTCTCYSSVRASSARLSVVRTAPAPLLCAIH